MSIVSTITLMLSTTFAISSTPSVIASEDFFGDGFSMQIPNGWKSIPKRVIDERMQAVAEYGGGSFVDYDAGFQLVERQDLEYPYVFIEMKDKAVTFSEFKVYYSELFEDAEEKSIDSYSDLFNAAEIHHKFFDEKRQALFMSMSVNTASDDSLRGLTAIFFSKSGILQMSFYSKEGEFNEYLRDFDKIIDSLTYEQAD